MYCSASFYFSSFSPLCFFASLLAFIPFFSSLPIAALPFPFLPVPSLPFRYLLSFPSLLFLLSFLSLHTEPYKHLLGSKQPSHRHRSQVKRINIPTIFSKNSLEDTSSMRRWRHFSSWRHRKFVVSTFVIWSASANRSRKSKHSAFSKSASLRNVKPVNKKNLQKRKLPLITYRLESSQWVGRARKQLPKIS